MKALWRFQQYCKHNYPLYLHNVKLIALTFPKQRQRPRDGLNRVLPCEQSSTHQAGNRVQTSCSLQLAFHPEAHWLFNTKREGKENTTRAVLAPSTTVKHILLHKKLSLILTELFLKKTTEFLKKWCFWSYQRNQMANIHKWQ